MIEPAGRVAMVSGASRGIGRAVVEALHLAGWNVSAASRDPKQLTKILAPIEGPRLLCARYDAGDRATHAEWLDATIARFGHLDALVNNAGVGSRVTLETGDEAAFDAAWAVNVKGPFFLTRLCLPYLRASGSGRVVNVASLSGKRVRNDNIAYAMTKHALVALSHGTRRLGWDDGVRTTALCPGFVSTDLTMGVTKVPREKMTGPADLGSLVVTILGLPNEASVPELLVNCQLEDAF